MYFLDLSLLFDSVVGEEMVPSMHFSSLGFTVNSYISELGDLQPSNGSSHGHVNLSSYVCQVKSQDYSPFKQRTSI